MSSSRSWALIVPGVSLPAAKTMDGNSMARPPPSSPGAHAAPVLASVEDGRDGGQ
jgi:hypothetical protein